MNMKILKLRKYELLINIIGIYVLKYILIYFSHVFYILKY